RQEQVTQRRAGSASPPARAKRSAPWLTEEWPPAVAFLVIAVVWEGAVRLTNTPAYLVPAPSAIAVRMFDALPALFPDALITLGEALGGLLVASSGALVAAVLMATSRWAERIFFPLAVV